MPFNPGRYGMGAFSDGDYNPHVSNVPHDNRETYGYGLTAANSS